MFFQKKVLINQSFVYALFNNFFKYRGFNKDTTLKEVYEFSKINLYMYSVNISTFKLVKFSHETHPDMKVLDAAYMSCSMPFVFQPLYYDNGHFVDGGLINPYPLNLCLKDQEKEEVLAFRIVDDTLKPADEGSNIFYYGFYMFYRLIKENYNFLINDEVPNELIIPSTTLSITDAKEIINNREIREKMIKDGKKFAILFLKYKNNKS